MDDKKTLDALQIGLVTEPPQKHFIRSVQHQHQNVGGKKKVYEEDGKLPIIKWGRNFSRGKTLKKSYVLTTLYRKMVFFFLVSLKFCKGGKLEGKTFFGEGVNSPLPSPTATTASGAFIMTITGYFSSSS